MGCSSDVERLEPKPLVSIEDSLSVKKIWSKNLGKSLDMSRGKHSALVLADRVVGVDGRSNVTALSREKGKVLWSLSIDAAFGSGVGGDHRHAVIAGLDGQVFLIDTTEGSITWKAQATSEVLAVPTLSQDAVIVQAVDGSVQAFDRNDGAPLWRYQTGIPVLTLRGTASPKVWRERVLAGFSNGKLVSLDINTGEPTWERELGTPEGRTELDRLIDLDGDFLIKDDIAYAVTFQGKVAAIELYSGRLLWSEAISSSTGLAEFAGQLYVTDDQGHIWTLNSRTGTVLWSQTKLEGRQLSAPIVVDDYLVVSDFEGYVHWLDLESGKTRARKRSGKAPVSLTQDWSTGHTISFSADAKISVFQAPK